MGNMCCRREVYAPNGTDSESSRCGLQQQSVHQQLNNATKQHPPHCPAMSSAYHSAGDDCAINELLEGRMDLDVLMPDGRQVKLTVERRTPMMDLLVQAASATKISPGGHVIQVFGDGGSSALHYKPSTPVGSLDTKTICIVPKKEAGDPLARRMGKTANRPFEPTFRVQVHLPRNQLTVLRVSPRIKISELKSMVCKEKGLDTSRYQLVRPSGPTQTLAGDMTLAEYGSTEITLLSNSSIESHICNSTSHIIPYSKRTEDTKRKTGILRLLTEDANNKVNNITNCNSAFQVDGGQNRNNKKSEDAQGHQNRYKPKKRRPAPPPPPPILPEAPSHSRQSSSDSSGYHEATSSFLHEGHSGEEKASSDSSGVSSLDAKDQTMQPSPPPPIPNSKKKKAPAPPPPSKQKEKPHHRPAPACPPTKNNKSKSLEELPATKDSATTAYKATNCCSGDVEKTPKEMTVQIALSEYRDDGLDQKSSIISPREKSTKKEDPVILSQQTTGEKTPHNSVAESLPSSKRNPTAEFKISTYTATVRDPIIRDKPVIPKDSLVEKDYLTRDPILSSRDHTISADHVISRDPVRTQNSADEKKVDVVAVPCLWDSEGQPRMTVAAKATSTANASTDAVKEKEIKHEVAFGTADNKENSDGSVAVPDTHRRTPEKKTDKGEVVSTRVALVALNARIEQDVTQQEIASSIQAAFHSVDYAPQQPSLLAIKQRNTTEDSTAVPPASTPWGCSESPGAKTTTTSTTTTVRVPLNLDSGDRNCEKSSTSAVESPRKAGEKEALVIDDEYPVPKRRPISTGCAPSVNLKRSSSLLNLSPGNASNLASSKGRVRQLQRSLSDLTTDVKEDFEAEQERLQREYLKLQRQFLLWQQQLMNNHAMLREECIVPKYQARTLRQSHSLPEGEDTFDARAPPSVPPLVSRSLSYEPTKDRCSTLPRSAINITSLEFGSIPLGNGTSTLRSSKTKNYFKPPQIRASTKSRQRLPPEIKREGDVDITDDAKMLTTILPSFETLKLITENHDEDSTTVLGIANRLRDTTSTRAKSTTTTTHTEGVRKGPVVHLSSTFPKLNNINNNHSRLSNGTADKTNADRDLKYVNGDTGQTKQLRVSDCSIAKSTAEQSLQQPPPPPPMPVVNGGGVSKCPVVNKNSIKSTGHRNGVGKRAFTPSVDPREQLMLEIRKFGGRTALRKISLAS